MNKLKKMHKKISNIQLSEYSQYTRAKNHKDQKYF